MERLEDRSLPSGVIYAGGPVMHNPLVVPIFYGSAWTSTAQANEIEMLHTFLGYITSGNNALMTFLNGQYNVGPATPGNAGRSYTIGSGSVWSGNSAEPAGNDVVNVAVPNTLIDSTYPLIIQHEIAAGHVPVPTANTVYVFFSPPGTAVYDSVRNGVPTGREYYGYHFVFPDRSTTTGYGYYAAIISPGNASQTLSGDIDGKPLNAFQAVTETITHEVAESITDPNCDDSGWTDPAYPDDGEIADMGLEPTRYDQVNDFYQKNWLTLLGDYVVPQLWSNKARGAAALPGASPGATTSATTLSTRIGPTLTPISGLITQQSPSVFSWSSIKNANWYEFELEDITANTVVMQTTAKTSLIDRVTAGHTYRWMVRAFSNDGVMGNWSTISRFTVQA
ncbi:MAG TPA: hypothetical protein VKA15_25710 [Isosphaeraceae bacterium]|nr:hypothetical protein [Isosphaeraceae bacterium]